MQSDFSDWTHSFIGPAITPSSGQKSYSSGFVVIMIQQRSGKQCFKPDAFQPKIKYLAKINVFQSDILFFEQFWSRPPRILNNQNGSFFILQIFGKIEFLKESKAFLKTDWKHHANILEYVRGLLDRATYCFFNGFFIYPILVDIQNASRKIDAAAYL